MDLGPLIMSLQRTGESYRNQHCYQCSRKAHITGGSPNANAPKYSTDTDWIVSKKRKKTAFRENKEKRDNEVSHTY